MSLIVIVWIVRELGLKMYMCLCWCCSVVIDVDVMDFMGVVVHVDTWDVVGVVVGVGNGMASGTGDFVSDILVLRGMAWMSMILLELVWGP